MNACHFEATGLRDLDFRVKMTFSPLGEIGGARSMISIEVNLYMDSYNRGYISRERPISPPYVPEGTEQRGEARR